MMKVLGFIGTLLMVGTTLAQTTTNNNQWVGMPLKTGQQGGMPKAYTVVKPLSLAPSASAGTANPQALGAISANSHGSGHGPIGLPLWLYYNPSSRDNNQYVGFMVGKNPFTEGGTSKIHTLIVPVAITTNTIGQSVDPNTGLITSIAGVTTFDPTAADSNCMAAPNNVPATVFRQSPIFENAKFKFGGTNVGNTQYLDAFQRANFWNTIGWEDYHVLLNPITVLPKLVLNVPPAYGTSFTPELAVQLGATQTPCGPEAIVDINWLDAYIVNTYMPSLMASGALNSGAFPIFQVYNTFLDVNSPTPNLAECCILGYHGAVAYTPVQTYAVADFDTTGNFGPGAQDSAVLAHEIGEWVNDPYGSNFVPLWGNTGQVQGGCQGNLEVGDPLTGALMPPVKMPNGFTYHLQELAFYSWFFGKPSTGVNGWYSSNGTFTTDAGAPCVFPTN